MVKNLYAMWGTWVWSLCQEDPLEKGMATHSSTLAWRIPWTEEPGGLQSMGSQKVRHDWATFTPKKKKTKGTPQSFKTLLCWAQRQNASYLFSKHKSSSLRSEIHFRRKENEECGFQDFLKLDRVPSAYQLCQQRTAPESSSGEQSGYQDNTSERSLWSIALGMCCFQGCGLQKCLPWSGKAWLRERPRDSREAAL